MKLELVGQNVNSDGKGGLCESLRERCQRSPTAGDRTENVEKSRKIPFPRNKTVREIRAQAKRGGPQSEVQEKNANAHDEGRGGGTDGPLTNGAKDKRPERSQAAPLGVEEQRDLYAGWPGRAGILSEGVGRSKPPSVTRGVVHNHQ